LHGGGERPPVERIGINEPIKSCDSDLKFNVPFRGVVSTDTASTIFLKQSANQKKEHSMKNIRLKNAIQWTVFGSIIALFFFLLIISLK